MIYAFGHISGAHLNPAVTLAVAIRGRIDYMSAIAYTVAQFVGALLGAAQQKEVLAALVPPEMSGYPEMPSGVEVGTALLLEITYTFALAIVVLNVATVKKHATNSFYGLAIGFTVTAAAYAAGSISGGAFNPAIGIALPAVHGVTDDFLLYLFGPLLGGALAGGFFRMTADAEELKELKRT
jgi:aquaporin Z